MRKIFFEKIKTKITREELIDAFNKAVDSAKSHNDFINVSESIRSVLMRDEMFHSILINVFSDNIPKIEFKKSGEVVLEFTLEMRTYLRLKRKYDDKRNSLYEEVLKNKEKSIDALKKYLSS
jgi:hypothetical protein